MAILYFLCVVSSLCAAAPVVDGRNSVVRLRQDLDKLQRHVYRSVQEGASSLSITPITDKLETLQKQMQALQGKVETLDLVVREINTLQANLRSMSSHLETLAKQVPSPAVVTKKEKLAQVPHNKEVVLSSHELLTKAKEHILYTQYAKAEHLLRSLLDNYPDDKIAPIAHYYLGKVFFIRKAHKTAAAHFAKAIQRDASMAEAPDALLQLAESLFSLKETDNACTVLRKLESDYKNLAMSVKSKVESLLAKRCCAPPPSV